MKTTIPILLTCLLSIGTISARDWTSVDGANTFNADYVSHNDEFVTVMKGIKKVRFKISLLSETDRSWLNTQKAETTKPTDTDANTDLGEIGEKLQRSLTRFDGRRYARFTLEKKPEYYLVYFSASW